MRKLPSYLFAILAFTSLTFFTGCGEDTEDPSVDKALEPLPADNGTVEITFTNFPNTGTATVSAAPADVVSVSVRIRKTPTGSRPQKLRIWEATQLNTRGTQVGSTIDLRNVDDQTKTVDYTVPTSTGTKYLYFEVDESGDKFQRRLLQVNISGSATIAEWTGITLGAQANANGSRVASATGDVYRACDIAENIRFVDITYALLPPSVQTTPTLLSNPQRATEGLSTTVPSSNTECANQTTGGGRNTYFSGTIATGVNYDTADDAALNALNVPTSGAGASQKITVQNGGTYAFVNSDGKKGLIKVTSINTNSTDGGTITLNIKVQR